MLEATPVSVADPASRLSATAYVRSTACFALLTGLALGCGGGASAIPRASVDVDHVSNAIVEKYDRNGDGALTEGEAIAAPPIADRFARYDDDGDGAVSAEELKESLGRVFDPTTSVVAATCLVRRNGKPLQGAKVRFVPIEQLTDVLPVGEGVSDARGAAMISAEPGALPDQAPEVPGLMRPGLYLVEVTHDQINLPAKFNENTVLGKELSRQTITVERAGIVVDVN